MHIKAWRGSTIKLVEVASVKSEPLLTYIVMGLNNSWMFVVGVRINGRVVLRDYNTGCQVY
jgi:hypothetical protein